MVSSTLDTMYQSDCQGGRRGDSCLALDKPGRSEVLSGTQKAVLVITAFAFGLMIFSVSPWSSVIDARPALADYYATHEVQGAQPFWF